MENSPSTAHLLLSHYLHSTSFLCIAIRLPEHVTHSFIQPRATLKARLNLQFSNKSGGTQGDTQHEGDLCVYWKRAQTNISKVLSFAILLPDSTLLTPRITQ